MGNWVQTWGMSHAGMSATSYSSGRTYRLVVNSAISGSQVRIRLSNRFGRNDITLSHLRAALCSPEGQLLGESIPLTVDTKNRVSIPAGKMATTDPAALSVPVEGCFCISFYAEQGQLHSGNQLDNVLLLSRKGNRTEAKSFSYQKRPKDLLICLASRFTGMYIPRPIPVFDTVELFHSEAASAIVCFGDSLTQQGRWSNPFEHEIRTRFPGKFSVINRAITGNKVLHDTKPNHLLRDFFGKSALARIQWDVMDFQNISHMIVNLGTNDLILPGTSDAPKSETVSAEELTLALRTIGQLAKERGIRCLISTCIPFGRSKEYTPEKEALRVRTNELIRQGIGYDGLIESAEAFASQDNPSHPKEGYTGPDRMHPNELGGAAIASAVPMDFFNNKPIPERT